MDHGRLHACWILVATIVLLAGNAAKAQTDYLEPIGGSEVELYFYLNADPQADGLLRDGGLLELTAQNIHATYTLQRGKVSDITYHQAFSSAELAEEAYLRIRHFLLARGLLLTDIRESANHHIVSGAGNGMTGTLMMVPRVGGGVAIDAQISARQ